VNVENLRACPEFFLHKSFFFGIFSVISQILINLVRYLLLLPVEIFSYTNVIAPYDEPINEKYYTAVKNNTTTFF
jgi:hypothetical protein